MRPARVVLHGTAALALGALASLGPVASGGAEPAPNADHPGCGASSCYAATKLFDPGLTDFQWRNNQDLQDAAQWAAGKLKDPKPPSGDPGCYPPKRFTVAIFTGTTGDPKLDPLVAKGRTDAVAGYLQKNAGIAPGTVDWTTPPPGKGQSDGQMEVTYNGVDRDPPALKVTWVPPKGTKRKKGDTIAVTIVASERHEDGHASWPTGVQSLQLLADDGLVEPTGQYRPPQPCARRTLPVTYTVPADPPPVVHLHALAEDGVGHESSEGADFPTVDWTGTLDFSIENRAPRSVQRGSTHLEFKLDEKQDGSVEGTVEGAYTFADSNYQCQVSSIAPGHVRARVTGTRTDTAMSLRVTDVVDTPPQLTPCLGRPVRGISSAMGFPQTANVLAQLVARPGRYHGERSEPSGGPMSTGQMSWTVDIQKPK
jgi:hypothetical protein